MELLKAMVPGLTVVSEADTQESLQPQESPTPVLRRLIEQLILLTSMLKELETQSHLIHLNYEGDNFLSVHAFLKDRYEEHLEQFDRVAELVRSMDYWMPLCSCGLKDTLAGFQHICSHEGREMLVTYFGNIEAMGYLAKRIEPLAQEAGAPDVANAMADLVGAAFKASWFLKATLRGC